MDIEEPRVIFGIALFAILFCTYIEIYVWFKFKQVNRRIDEMEKKRVEDLERRLAEKEKA